MTDYNTPYRDGQLNPFKLAKTTVIAAGQIVGLNATGFALPAEHADTVTVIGRADAAVDNSSGGDGDRYVTVSRKRQFLLANDDTTPVAQEHMGKACYISAANTVTADSNDNIEAGVVMGLEADGMVWVEMK